MDSIVQDGRLVCGRCEIRPPHEQVMGQVTEDGKTETFCLRCIASEVRKGRKQKAHSMSGLFAIWA